MLIVKMICLAIGTVLAVLFILLTMRGKKEDWRIEGVPEKEFSDKELWAAGFAMQQMPMFSMDSAVGKKMISASAILHPENGGRFVEYWARLYWARTLSMSLLVLALAGGGAALYYFKFRKPKTDTTGHDDLDEYDFGEDEDADEEPAEIEIYSEDGQEDET